MKFYSVSLPNVTPVKLVTGKANCGIGLLTAVVGGFCSFFGMENDMYAEKMVKAEALAMEALEKAAKTVGADGVMDIRCQIDGLSFLVSGTAYKSSPEEKAECVVEEKVKNEANVPAKNKKTVVPVLLKGGKYECPCCGSNVKKWQETCLCFSKFDWSQIV